jgi:8-oxo-dGTP diphosphatase
MPNQFNIGSNALIVRDGKVLLGLRKNVAGAGTWGLPGGHLEFGEELDAAVKRELLEETGLVIKDLELVCITNAPQEQAHYIQLVFMVRNFDGEVQLKEPNRCERWSWFPLDQLPPNDQLFFGHRDIFPAFLHGALVRGLNGNEVPFLPKPDDDGSKGSKESTPAYSSQANSFKPGLYRHFKGGCYRALGVVRSSEDRNEEFVAYRSLENGCTWVRPLAMFLEHVDRDGYAGPRFSYLG